MTLIDTSVWINHFRRGERRLAGMLEESSAGIHPFVIGELACGNLRDRAATLGDLSKLPHAKAATEAEVLNFVESRRLRGKGLGWVDVHILASAALSGWDLWTADRVMQQAAERMGIGAKLPL